MLGRSFQKCHLSSYRLSHKALNEIKSTIWRKSCCSNVMLGRNLELTNQNNNYFQLTPNPGALLGWVSERKGTSTRGRAPPPCSCFPGTASPTIDASHRLHARAAFLLYRRMPHRSGKINPPTRFARMSPKFCFFDAVWQNISGLCSNAETTGDICAIKLASHERQSAVFTHK